MTDAIQYDDGHGNTVRLYIKVLATGSRNWVASGPASLEHVTGCGFYPASSLAAAEERAQKAEAQNLAFISQNNLLIQRNLALGDAENGPLVRAERAEAALVVALREKREAEVNRDGWQAKAERLSTSSPPSEGEGTKMVDADSYNKGVYDATHGQVPEPYSCGYPNCERCKVPSEGPASPVAEGEKCKSCKRSQCGALKFRDDPRELRICRHATRLERDFLLNRVSRLEDALRRSQPTPTAEDDEERDPVNGQLVSARVSPVAPAAEKKKTAAQQRARHGYPELTDEQRAENLEHHMPPPVAPAAEGERCNCSWPAPPRGPTHGVRCPAYISRTPEPPLASPSAGDPTLPSIGEIQDCIRRAAGYLSEMSALADEVDLSELRHHAGHVWSEMQMIERLLNEHRDRAERERKAKASKGKSK